MDFAVSPEQKALLELARRFMKTEVEPYIADYDREERFPADIIRKASPLGLLGGVIPNEYGGSAMDYCTYELLIEEISTTCHIVGLAATAASGLVGSGLLSYGTEEQKKQFLAPLARGESFAGAAITEPASGTDVARMQTKVRRDGEDYVLQGAKTWISFLDVADWLLTFAVLDPKSDGDPRYCAFIVPRESPGLLLRPFKNKLGFRPVSTGEVIFDDVRVPADLRLGDEGDGLRVAMHSVENGRLGVAARACGLSRACLQAASSYAQERYVFGKPIAHFQLVQSMITDMVAAIESAHMLTLHLAWIKNSSLPGARVASSLAKMVATDAAMTSALHAVQIHGAYGCSDELPVARYFRDAKVFQIIEGHNQLHRSLIAEYQLGIRSDRRQPTVSLPVNLDTEKFRMVDEVLVVEKEREVAVSRTGDPGVDELG